MCHGRAWSAVRGHFVECRVVKRSQIFDGCMDKEGFGLHARSKDEIVAEAIIEIISRVESEVGNVMR